MDSAFTDEEVNQLIGHVRMHTILYVQGVDSKQKREKLWTEISQAIGKPGKYLGSKYLPRNRMSFIFI